MPWTVDEGPHNAGWSGRDAVGWVWILTNEQGVRHPLAVWVSGTAMAVSPEYLPPETARARETLGRSEADRLLADAILPTEVMLGTTGRSIQQAEAGWWVELRGEGESLAVLVRLYADEDLNVVERSGQTYMRSTALDEIADEQEVRLTAARLLREALGAAWLEGEQINPVDVGAVTRRN